MKSNGAKRQLAKVPINFRMAITDRITSYNVCYTKLLRIDAIHCDDYFYPYPVAAVAFPDALDFAKNPRHFAPDQLEDWRRNNVDLTIQLLSKTIV